MEDNLIKVYVKIDSDNVIKEINSSIFIGDTTDWVQIDEGIGGIFAHAQSMYLEGALMDENNIYNYKLVDGVVIELTTLEKETLFPIPTPIPSDKDRINAIEEMLLMML